MKRDFISITDLKPQEIFEVLSLAGKIKKTPDKFNGILRNRTLGMIFEKPSLRTRVSFEVGMTQLGGHAIYLSPNDIGLGKREPIKDVSRVLGRMTDIIMARTFLHSTVVELAKYSSVPVINGLSDLEHPCQILADLLTIIEKKGKIKGIKIAFVGDGENNVTHSLALATTMLGAHISIASPKKYKALPEISTKAKEFAKRNKVLYLETDNPEIAVKDADVIYTDTWVSMGDESEAKNRMKNFKNYKVTQKLMNKAMKNAIFMHDMPAYRGFEAEESVIDGKQSVIIDQAENRLHAQKGLIAFLFSSGSINK